MVSSGVSDGQLNMPALVHSNNEQRTPGDKFSSKHTSSYRLIQTANPETATGQVLLSISRTTAILLIPKTTLPKTLSSSMLLLLLYLRARSLGGSGGTAAVARRRCWLASVFFTANSCHVPSRFAQFSPPIHCPSRGYM